MPRLLLLLLLIVSPLYVQGQNTLGNPPNTVDGLLLVEGAQALLSGGQADNVVATPDGSGIQLKAGATAGSITLKPMQTNFAFNEALPSWNGRAPKDGGFRVWMAATVPGAQSVWFEAGTWGKLSDDTTTRIVQLPYGVYNIDNLRLATPAQGVSVRIDLARATAKGPSPVVRLFALSYTNSLGDRNLAARFGARKSSGGLAPVSIEVPYRSQVVSNERYIGRICSPCSVAMVLAAYGVNVDTQAIATELYDRASDAFGVWHRSVQSAAQHGVRGYVARFRSWVDVQRELAAGHIVCASIRFQPGEVQDPLAPYGKRKNGTLGHLVLIRGISPDGKIIVHDTASKDYGVSELWIPDELGKAWFDKGGVGYVFTGPQSKPAKRGSSR